MITRRQFTLTLCVDNAAFQEDEASAVAEILEEAATKVRDGEQDGRIRDVNGNRVGFWTFEEKEST